MNEKMPFRRFGTMIDCSRNAVMNVPTLKKWIDILADLDYNCLLLYTEDTYEVDDNPYFGYLRGRYSQDELKEIDRYAGTKGLEVIPCIQTLAHINAITRWPAYAPHIDINDILLAGDEEVYTLIDKMFATISKCFTSKTVNIGMDEAHMIGRGRYYDLHGDTDRVEILLAHIKKVAEIGKKYGLTLAMWSDMFFRLVAGDYYNLGSEINEDIKKQIPDNVELIYWDYYSTDKKRYDKMLEAHERIKENTWFAGGLWSWVGFAPHNEYSMKATKAALRSCREHSVKDVFLTMWGDDGGECSKFSLLPSLFYASEIAKGNSSLASIKEKFKDKFGISFDRFMLLDLPNSANKCSNGIINAERYLLYNDPFMGVLDCTISGGENEGFAKCARKLSLMRKDETYGYLFNSLYRLCDVLSIKAELGVKTRAAYNSGDKENLDPIITDYIKLSKKLEAFYNAYKEQWYIENKGHGFDVQDIRLGGLITRVKHCTEMLKDYRNGKIDHIDELDEALLDICGNGTEFCKKPICYHSWKLSSTANVL